MIHIAKRMREVVKAAEPHFEDFTFESECDDEWTASNAIVIVNLIERMHDEFRDYDRVAEAAFKHIKDAFPRAVWVTGKGKLPETGTVCHVHTKSSGLWFEVEVYNVTKMRQAQERHNAAVLRKRAKEKAAGKKKAA